HLFRFCHGIRSRRDCARDAVLRGLVRGAFVAGSTRRADAWPAHRTVVILQSLGLPARVFLRAFRLADRAVNGPETCRAASELLHPAEFPHGPPGVPDLGHVADLAALEVNHVDVVASGALAGGGHRAALAGVGAGEHGVDADVI